MIGYGRPLRFGVRSAQHAHDVGLLHDQEFVAVELHLGTRPLAEQHPVADLDVDGNQLAALVASARADPRGFALRRLFLGGVWNDDAALGFFFGVDSLDHDTVMQRTKFGLRHDISLYRLAIQIWLAVESRSGI